MFYRVLLTYFFRCRYLPSVLAAASLPSQSPLCSVLFCKLLLLIAPIFSAIFLCVHHNFLSVSPSPSLSLSSSLTLSFDFRLFPCHFHLDMCVCLCVAHMSISVCAPFLGHLLCQAIFQINAQIVKPTREAQGGAELSIGLLFRRKLALQIAAVAVVVFVNYTHVACQLICQVAAGKSAGEKVKQFAIKSTLNLHSSTWGLCLGYLVSSLSKICDRKIFHSTLPLLPPLLQLPISDRDRSTAFPTQENWRKINL